MKEIGSNFELSYTKGQGSGIRLENTESMMYLRSAREALFLIAQSAVKKGINRAILPALCCSSMVQPFIQLGFEVCYYKITKLLVVDEEDLKTKICDNSVMLVMNYYGIKSYSSIEKITKNFNNVVTIQDCTQHVFARELYDDCFDYQIGSIRKWVAIPDGAFIRKTTGKLPVDTGIEIVDDGYVDLNYQCMCEKTEYLSSKNLDIKSSFRDKYARCMGWLRGEIRPHLMSELSKKIFFEDINVKALIEERTNNYNALKQAMADLDIAKYAIEQNSPLCFPIVIQGRDQLQRELAGKGVYCQVLWPLNNEAKISCEFSCEFADTMLAVPCDQRYTAGDMEYVSSIIKNGI